MNTILGIIYGLVICFVAEVIFNTLKKKNDN